MTERDDECELGYWLGKPYWGKGYMPEAAREILRHGFEDIGMTTIWCASMDIYLMNLILRLENEKNAEYERQRIGNLFLNCRFNDFFV